MKVTKVSIGILKVFRRSRSCECEEEEKRVKSTTSSTCSFSLLTLLIQMTREVCLQPLDYSLIQVGHSVRCTAEAGKLHSDNNNLNSFKKKKMSWWFMDVVTIASLKLT